MSVGLVLQRLREGVPASDLQSPFDPRARWIYAILLTQLAVAIVLLSVFGFRVNISLAMVALVPLWFVGSAMLARRYGHSVLANALETTALLYAQGIPTMLLLFSLTAISRPLADASLAAADRALHFDWPAFAVWFVGHPYRQWSAVIAYHSFGWQPFLLAPALVFTRRGDRAWRLAAAAVIASLITAIIYPLAPAVGTFYHFSVQAGDFPNLKSPWQFGPVLIEIKNGARDLGPQMFTGLVSFPSYHAAAASIFVWAAAPFRRLLPLVVILNAAMCAAAMLVGGHYLIDIIAGLGVGAAAIPIAHRLYRPLRSNEMISASA